MKNLQQNRNKPATKLQRRGHKSVLEYYRRKVKEIFGGT